AVGADVAVSSSAPLTAATVDDVRRTPGVAAVVAVGTADGVVLRAGRTSDAVQVRVVDLAALASVQRGLPGVAPLDVDAAGAPDGAVRAVVAGAVDVDLDDEDLLVEVGAPAEQHDLAVVAVTDRVPGVTGGTTSVLVDDAAAQRLGITAQVDRLLVRAAPRSDVGEVAAAVRHAVEGSTGSGADVVTRAQVVERVTAGQLVGGVRTATALATLTSLALSALALGLGVTLGARSRGRQLALLTTLGVPSRDARSLVRWEVLPWSLVAVAAGLAAGALLAPVMLGTTDVSVLAGGAQPPPPTLGAVGLGVLLAAYLLLVAGAVLVAGAGARRTSAVAVLREGEA
ncbi:FtsX-like permease family protein, partial [Cellulomonas biazotea]